MMTTPQMGTAQAAVTALNEHRAAAALTRLDVDALQALARVLGAITRAARDADLDRAAAALAGLLSLLPYTHPLTVAARCGLDVQDARRAHRRDQTQAAHAISAAIPRGWAANQVPYAELQRRRAVPGPLARDGAA